MGFLCPACAGGDAHSIESVGDAGTQRLDARLPAGALRLPPPQKSHVYQAQGQHQELDLQVSSMLTTKHTGTFNIMNWISAPQLILISTTEVFLTNHTFLPLSNHAVANLLKLTTKFLKS